MPKLSVQLNDYGNAMLEKLAKGTGTTKVEILRRALALYDYVEGELSKEQGRNLSITGPDGAAIKDIILH